MKPVVLKQAVLAIALTLAAGAALAADRPAPNVPQDDTALANKIRHEILTYPYYSIWDDISFRVSDGQVELLGAVNRPFKKSDIERIVRKTPGVAAVVDQIKVLPVSTFDDRLRRQVARAIYGDPVFMEYRYQPLPPIHIIVENGHVTLTGVVNTDMDKQVAGMRANAAGLSFGMVVNNLQVEHPSPKKS